MDWYPHEISTFDADTLTLTLAEDGAYCRLLRWYYLNERPIPADPLAQAAICRVGLVEWEPMRAKILRYFVTRDGATSADVLHHDKCDSVIIKQTKRRKDNKTRQKKHRKRGIKAQQNPAKSGAEGGDVPDCTITRPSRVSHGSRGEERKGDSSKPPVVPQGGQAAVDDFVRFWDAYPLKVGKKAALRQWLKAKDRPAVDIILAAVARYIAAPKPADREFCHPSTWISQGRWEDQHGLTGAATVQPELAFEMAEDAPPYRKTLLASVGAGPYRAWLEKLEFRRSSSGDHAVKIYCPTKFHQNHVALTFGAAIAKALGLPDGLITYHVKPKQEKPHDET